MVGTELHIVAVDPDTGEVAWQCPGPDARGACPRIPIGAPTPCIGKALLLEGTADDPYVVPRGMSLCPVTLAAACGVSMGRSHDRVVAAVA